MGSKKEFLGIRGIAKPNEIEQILVSNLDVLALKRSLIVTATDLTRGLSEAFYAFVGAGSNEAKQSFTSAFGEGAHALSNNAEFALAVRASAAIPGAFEPVPMNLGIPGNKEFVDGGVANNIPVTLAVNAGATDITVIQLQPAQTSEPNYPTTNLLEIGLASLTVMQQTLLKQDMELVNKMPGVTIRYIRPAAPLALSVLAFSDQNSIDIAFEAGHTAANSATTLTKG